MERFIYIPLPETSLSKSSNHFSPKYLIIQSMIRYSACTWSYFVVVPLVVLQVLLVYYPWLNVDPCFWSSVFPGRKKTPGTLTEVLPTWRIYFRNYFSGLSLKWAVELQLFTFGWCHHIIQHSLYRRLKVFSFYVIRSQKRVVGWKTRLCNSNIIGCRNYLCF